MSERRIPYISIIIYILYILYMLLLYIIIMMYQDLKKNDTSLNKIHEMANNGLEILRWWIVVHHSLSIYRLHFCNVPVEKYDFEP